MDEDRALLVLCPQCGYAVAASGLPHHQGSKACRKIRAKRDLARRQTAPTCLPHGSPLPCGACAQAHEAHVRPVLDAIVAMLDARIGEVQDALRASPQGIRAGDQRAELAALRGVRAQVTSWAFEAWRVR